MKLSDDDISKIAIWEPLNDKFARTAQFEILLITSRIQESGVYTVNVFEDGGLSNYVAFLVCHTEDLRHVSHVTYRRFNPLAVNLSLMAPIGVIGQIQVSYGTRFSCIDNLDLDNLLDPENISDEVGKYVVKTIADSPFRLMHPEEVKRPLPPHVVPYEYCLGTEPHDKYFHALFANTD